MAALSAGVTAQSTASGSVIAANCSVASFTPAATTGKP
jgi:hypothetical protein